MKKSTVMLLACAVLALPAAAEITARKERVGGSRNLDVIRLDGTTLHGAVFATGSVDLGETGRVVYNRPILRWATDRSLGRTRLVPGSRWEGTE